MEKKDQESDWHWVDYMEDDLDESLKEDLSRWLDHSQVSRDILTDLKAVRSIVAASGKEASVDDERFARIQTHVMNRLSGVEMEPTPGTGPSSRFFPSQVYLVAGLMTLVVAFSIIFIENKANRGEQGEVVSAQARAQDWLIEDSMLGSQPMVNTVIEYRDHSDLLQDNVVDALNQMTDQEVRNALDGLSD